MVKPVAGQTVQTWHSLAYELKVKLHVCGGPNSSANSNNNSRHTYGWRRISVPRLTAR